MFSALFEHTSGPARHRACLREQLQQVLSRPRHTRYNMKTASLHRLVRTRLLQPKNDPVDGGLPSPHDKRLEGERQILGRGKICLSPNWSTLNLLFNDIRRSSNAKAL